MTWETWAWFVVLEVKMAFHHEQTNSRNNDFLAYFDKPEDVAPAYDEECHELRNGWAVLNFP